MYKECFNRNIKDERKLETQITYIFGMICQLSLTSFYFRMFKNHDLIIRRLKKKKSFYCQKLAKQSKNQRRTFIGFKIRHKLSSKSKEIRLTVSEKNPSGMVQANSLVRSCF